MKKFPSNLQSDSDIIHDLMIEKYSGSKGIRDIGMLVSAIERPFQTFDGGELYSTDLEKAAALIESIIANHPFVDGNKRTGYMVAGLFLLAKGIEISAGEDDAYDIVIQIASGKINNERIVDWLKMNTIKLSN